LSGGAAPASSGSAPSAEAAAGEARAPVRVCFFCYNAYPLIAGRKEGFGGGELDVVNLARFLAQDPSLAITLFTVTRECQAPFQWGRVRVVPLAPCRELRPTDSRFVRRAVVLAYMLRLLVRLLREPADLYFAKLASLEIPVLFAAAALRRVPFVYRLGSEWETNERDLRTIIFPATPFLAGVFRWCLRHATAVISQTTAQREALERNFGVRSRVVPNAHFIPDRRPVAEEKTTVLWVARTHPVKRPHLFLELAQRLAQRQFVMVMAPARGCEELFARIEAEARSIPNLRFVPGVSQEEIVRYYEQARVFVLTSESEGFPNVLIEALKNGTPVVSLEVNPDGLLSTARAAMAGPAAGDEVAVAAEAAGGGAEGTDRTAAQAGDSPFARHIRGRQIGWCAEGDFEELVRLVELMFTDEALWSRCVADARSFAENAFGIERIGSLYRELFHSLTARPPRR
jgi:glycosyltransferase involved in cell wall biosynthesis